MENSNVAGNHTQIKTWVKITLVVLILLAVIFLIYYFTSNGKITNENLKELESFTLVQPDNFYKNKREDTLKYLQAVYPTSKLDNLSDQDLAKLYNSLWTWYNCESSYGPSNGPWLKDGPNSNDPYVNSELCWQALPGCGGKWPKLPYVPQGWIYDWNTYMGVLDKQDTDQAQQVISQINYSDSTRHPKDITGSVPGQTYWNWFNGPNPIWMYQRAIFRYKYNPGLGESYIRYPDPKKPPQVYSTPALTPGEITDPNLPIPWDCPKAWWTGVPSGGYLEVTMASEPGLAPSPPICWFDGWRGSGTWVNVGKTIVVRNKVDGVFKLAQEAAQTKEGRETLKKYFKTSDPYEVCKKLVTDNGYGKCPINGPVVYDGRPNSNTYKKKINLNFSSVSGINQGSLVGNFADINANSAYSFTMANWHDWCDPDAKPNIDMPDYCVDKMRLGTHYMADRQAAIMTFDEPLFALGVYLGYDSIQMPHSSNGNGRYQYEYLELRGYPAEVRERDYSAFMMAVDSASAPTEVDYRVDFLIEYMPKMAALFSLRDILDPINGNSKPITVDIDWIESVRLPNKNDRPKSQENYKVGNMDSTLEVIKHRNKVNSEFAKKSMNRGENDLATGESTNRGENDLVTGENKLTTKENARWKDGCPINKFALGTLWEYNITAKDHISSMFTYLSIAFSDSVNYCPPNGKGRASSVGVYSVLKNDSDMPYA